MLDHHGVFTVWQNVKQSSVQVFRPADVLLQEFNMVSAIQSLCLVVCTDAVDTVSLWWLDVAGLRR